MANSLPYGDYIPTERDLFNLIGEQWPEKLRKDYIAGKFNSTQLLQFINENSADITDIQIQITTINGQIVTIQADIATLESDLEIVADDLADHVDASVAHGATGDIVGNLDYATALVGGVVFEAVAVADAVDSAISPITSVGAAGAAYVQAYAQSQTDAINTLANDLQTLQANFNDAVAVINLILATERTAKQRAI
jgi:uncharacterized protein YbjQ (UPF0145 family)